MGRLIIEQHVTADGFAAGPNGELDWIDGSVSEPGPMVDEALAELEHADAILLGATTYRLFIAYWPTALDDPLAAPINRLPKHIVSQTLPEARWGDHTPATVESGDPAATADRLKQTYDRDIIVWGSLQLASALLEAGKVDEARLRVAPVAIGQGIPLWDLDYGPMPLTLRSATPLSTGQVTLIYDVTR
ncbi:dihydrofolate reductase family protein [Demequina sp. NBRC 110051]|uniref:dihydrofolate reductase family protein n=1 Tax=Demequina sp. NBRC 110051 TaxID=1570340 RepID=UPI000A013689|nr:dihydrofolate reductase family protein [Demequina sp. NBRC 110051]